MKKHIIKIDLEKCKGCRLCVESCPQGVLEMSDGINSNGYHNAEVKDISKCTGCKFCALACPDAIIEVYREEE